MTSTTRGPTAKKSASKVSTYKHGSYAPISPVARGQIYSSRSEPSLSWQQTQPKSSAPSQRHPSVGGHGRSTYRKEVSKSQYITNVMPQPVPAPAVNGTGPARARSQFLVNPVNMSTTMSKPPVVEFAQAKIKETAG